MSMLIQNQLYEIYISKSISFVKVVESYIYFTSWHNYDNLYYFLDNSLHDS